MSNASAFEMDALDNRIRELVAYARERDGEDRAALFRNLVDLFLTGKAPSKAPTRNQLLDVLQALVPHVDAEGRRTVADLVANMSNPPMDLVLRLVQDRASLVSGLLRNVQYDDDELIELISKTGREHHQIIATREDLSANIWIALARAAPSAPAFDHQSTLALWSDDLGITRTKSSNSGTDHQDHTADTESNKTPIPNEPVKNTHSSHSEQDTPVAAKPDRPSATVTPLHPERTGSIRIIRTDEDLIADRQPATDPTTAEMEDKEGASDNISSFGPSPISKAAEALSAAEANRFVEEPAATATQAQNAAPRLAKDPGPGGWSWISDRDGFVTSISKQGLDLLGEAFEPVGSSVLDVLGLNAKLDHPVARAFQRRSAIHDAPIFLSVLDEKHQHWTLEATPFFSNCGGIFEGYEGTLTPVVPAQEDDPLATEDEGAALFLDELASRQRPIPRRQTPPPSFTDRASVFAGTTALAHQTDPLEMFAEDTHEAEETRSTQAKPATIEEPEQKQPQETPEEEPEASNPHNPVEDAAAAILQEVLAEALGHKKAEAPTRPEPELPQNTDARLPEAHKDDAAHIAATLDLLEEALSRLLTAAAKNAADPQIRLQGEIAAACIRSLRDQTTCN